MRWLVQRVKATGVVVALREEIDLVTPFCPGDYEEPFEITLEDLTEQEIEKLKASSLEQKAQA